MIVPNRCLVRMSIVRLCNYVIIFVYWSVDFASLNILTVGLCLVKKKKEKIEKYQKEGERKNDWDTRVTKFVPSRQTSTIFI